MLWLEYGLILYHDDWDTNISVLLLFTFCMPTYVYKVMRIYPNLAQPLMTKAYQLITPPVLFFNNDGVTYTHAGRCFNAL
jgi:hypothetical protein